MNEEETGNLYCGNTKHIDKADLFWYNTNVSKQYKKRGCSDVY